jgi:hypothetical protein
VNTCKGALVSDDENLYPDDSIYRDAKVQARIEARLVAFDEYREKLCDILHEQYERRHRSWPFDQEKMWEHLRVYAWMYLLGAEHIKRNRTKPPAAYYVRKLRGLGKALKRARSLTDAVVRDSVRGYLFLGWCEAYDDVDQTDPYITVIEDQLKKAVAALAALEAAASKGAEMAQARSGRPEGTSILSHEHIYALASTYQTFTGEIPGAGGGPFARFVKEFLTALNLNITEESVIAAIKGSRRRGRLGTSDLFIGRKIPPASR